MKYKYPALQELLGNYFHQDWRDEFPTPDAATQAYISGVDANDIRSAVAELDVMIQETPQIEMPTLLARLGSSYMALEPGHEGAAFSNECDPSAARLAHSQIVKQ